MMQQVLEREYDEEDQPPWISRLFAHPLFVLFLVITFMYATWMVTSNVSMDWETYRLSFVNKDVLAEGLLGMVAVGCTLRFLCLEAISEISAYKEDHKQFRRNLIMGRLQQVPSNLATLTSAEIERQRTKQQLSASDLEYLKEIGRIKLSDEEARKVRDWESKEKERDRQLSIEHLITKFEGEIRQIETRMEYEKPSAKRQSAEAMANLKGRIEELREIDKWRTKDPTIHRQLFEQFKRRYQ